MPRSAALKLLVIVDLHWCTAGDAHTKLVRTKHAIRLSDRRSRIESSSKSVSLKFRDRQGHIVLDVDAHLHVADTGKVIIHSHKLAAEVSSRETRGVLILVHLEQVEDVLRATVHFSSKDKLLELDRERPELRLSACELPPATVTEIEPSADGMEADSIYEVLLSELQEDDPALFAVHTERFLKAPHIVVPLLNHLASLTAEENLKFPVQLKRLSDQFRALLESKDSPLQIGKIERSHLETWADAQGKEFAFLDGGVARIAGLPGTEPTALRVGIYSVRAGDVTAAREKWELYPYVVGDIIDKNTGVVMEEGQQMDLRRLGEAARYTLEPLSGLMFLEKNKDVDSMFVHGPLINQFVQYDEIEPNFLPFIREDFLASAGISRSEVETAIKAVPSRDGKKMWRQFMAIYGYVALRVCQSSVPFVGVVERSAGSWLAQAVLDGAISAKLVNDAYKKKVMMLLARYSISDDFLFGCVLAEGEYLSPTEIPKNAPRRAREHWQPVVAQYPKPFATVLKTTDVSFPFRVEMNEAGMRKERDVMKLLYHTARLLPRYAFPRRRALDRPLREGKGCSGQVQLFAPRR